MWYNNIVSGNLTHHLPAAHMKAREFIVKPQKNENSTAVSAQLILPHQANPAGNVHGGEIIKLMDSTAGIAAQRHCRTNVVTARVDELCFKKPVRIGDYVTCTAKVVFAGVSSMEVFVTVESENLYTGQTQIALTAFFTMVSLDENDRPAPVPPVECGDDEYSKLLYTAGKNRYEKSKCRRKSAGSEED